MASPMFSKKRIHTNIHRLHRLHKMLYFTAFSREIGCSKSDEPNRGAIKSKSSGGWGEAAAQPMMFEEVMIQMGVQSNLCKRSKKLRGGLGGGGGQPPPMMFEEVMIQIGRDW